MEHTQPSCTWLNYDVIPPALFFNVITRSWAFSEMQCWVMGIFPFSDSSDINLAELCFSLFFFCFSPWCWRLPCVCKTSPLPLKPEIQGWLWDFFPGVNSLHTALNRQSSGNFVHKRRRKLGHKLRGQEGDLGKEKAWAFRPCCEGRCVGNLDFMN